jgi:type VI secretion system protein ImpH
VPWLYSYHFGLFGPFGPLPLHLTEVAYRQARSTDPALAAFCDVLQHRFLCFFFRAWADARKEMELDRPEAGAESTDGGARRRSSEHWAQGERLWELYVGALIGFGLHALRQRDRVPDYAKLFYAGRLLQPARNVGGLQAILDDYFQAPARVIRFVCRTVRLPRNVCCRLGGDSHIGRLGLSAIVGDTYEDHQMGFRVRMGPLSFAQFEDFLPGAAGLGELHDWVRLYVGRETDPNPDASLEAVWDLQLVLRGSEVPSLALGQSGRLGWTTWLTSRPCDRDVDDLVLHPPPDDPGKAAGESAQFAAPNAP